MSVIKEKESSIWIRESHNIVNIDSLVGLTFRNQLMSILLVMPTGQHLHVIFSFLSDMGATQGK